jgi:hypothetical protein
LEVFGDVLYCPVEVSGPLQTSKQVTCQLINADAIGRNSKYLGHFKRCSQALQGINIVLRMQ